MKVQGFLNEFFGIPQPTPFSPRPRPLHPFLVLPFTSPSIPFPGASLYPAIGYLAERSQRARQTLIVAFGTDRKSTNNPYYVSQLELTSTSVHI